MRGSSRDDARYVETTYYAGGRPGCGGNGKPVYVSQKIDDDVGVSPYLYSPARRNSWLVGADPCRANGWMEVRSSAEHAEHIQAGASGPWQEYNGTGWVRTAAIRALPPCSTPADDCVYVSGSSHQQHTHGVYVRIAMRCDGKPVYMQQTGAAWDRDDDNPRVSVARGGSRDGVRGGRAGLDGGGGSDYRRLYLFSPSGRESWMVGRDACKPSGWLEVHSAVDRVEGIDGTWREHVPGGSWASNPHIKLQLNALQDAFVGFSTRADGKLNDQDGVLWRLTSIATQLPPTIVHPNEEDASPGDLEEDQRRLDETPANAVTNDAALGGVSEPAASERPRKSKKKTDEPVVVKVEEGGEAAEGTPVVEGSLVAPEVDEWEGAAAEGAEAASGADTNKSTCSSGAEDTCDTSEADEAAAGESDGSGPAPAVPDVPTLAPPDGPATPPPPPPGHGEALASAPDACLDLIIEPSLEGGRLLAVEHSPSDARTAVREALRELGWMRRWLRPQHYTSPHVVTWLRRQLWHPSRVEHMSLYMSDDDLEPGRSGGATGRRSLRTQRSKIKQKSKDGGKSKGSSNKDNTDGAESESKEASGDAPTLGLRAWRKSSFRAEDLLLVQQACQANGLKFESVHLLTSDRQQTVPLELLRLWPARVRLFVEQRSHSLLLLAILIVLGGSHLRHKYMERRAQERAAYEREQLEKEAVSSMQTGSSRSQQASSASSKGKKGGEKAAAKKVKEPPDKDDGDEDRASPEGDSPEAVDAAPSPIDGLRLVGKKKNKNKQLAEHIQQAERDRTSSSSDAGATATAPPPPAAAATTTQRRRRPRRRRRRQPRRRRRRRPLLRRRRRRRRRRRPSRRRML